MRLFVILVLVQLALGLPVDKVPEHEELQGLPEEVVENGRTLRENDPDHPLWKRLDDYLEFLETDATPEVSESDVSFAAAAEETTAIHHGRCNGVPGTCIDQNAYMCGPANTIVKNKCPGGNNIRCCLDGFEIKPRPCDKDPRFACVDRTRETCANYLKNMCPGPTTTNCCIDKKITQPKVDPPKVDPPKVVVPMGLPPGCSVPNVPSIVDPSNRQLVLNTKINRGYAQFAHCYQRIAQPSGSFTSSSCRIPVWYAIAPYASRNVGKGEAAILGAIAGLSALGSSPLAIPAAAKLLYEAVSQGLGGATVCNTPTVTKRIVSLMFSIGVKNTANTLLSALEHGNRLIFADVGLFGQRYLEWRSIQDSATFNSDKVVTDFSKKMGVSAVNVRKLFNDGKAWGFPHDDFSGTPDTMELMVAASALYEAAREESSDSVANRYIKEANNMMAWREQFESVPPAFTSTSDRLAVFDAVTPTFTLTFRTFEWTYCEYGKRKGVDCTKTNWALFKHRWPPILDSFVQAYAKKDQVFPMPSSPDATDPM